MKKGTTRTVIIQDIDAEELYRKLREIVTDILRKEHPPPASSRSRLMSLSETAEYFCVSVRTINNWCRNGLLSPITLGARRVYFEETEVLDLIKKNKCTKKKI